MTEDKKPNPAAISVAVDEEEINDADIDQALAEEDPDFIQTLGEIVKDPSLTETQQDAVVEQVSLIHRLRFRVILEIRVWRERFERISQAHTRSD